MRGEGCLPLFSPAQHRIDCDEACLECWQQYIKQSFINHHSSTIYLLYRDLFIARMFVARYLCFPVDGPDPPQQQADTAQSDQRTGAEAQEYYETLVRQMTNNPCYGAPLECI